MSAIYEFYKNPKNQYSTEEETYHARIVPQGTIDIERMAEEIQQYSSLSTADVKGVLEMLVKLTARNLYYGFNVNLEGLGTLQMTLDCPPDISQKKVNAKSVKFKSVVFRPAASLKKALKNTPLTHVNVNVHSCKRSNEEIDAILTNYFNKHETMTRRDFQMLCGLTRSTAVRHLKRLKTSGKIVNISDTRHPVYRKGNFTD